MEPGFVDAILLLLIFMAGMLVTVWLYRRKRQVASPSINRKRGLVYFLKLAGFAALSLVMVIFGVMVFIGYQNILEDTRPAPSQVEIPDGLPFEVQEVTFPGGEGFRMAGWYIPPGNGVTIILLHGFGSNRTEMLWHAQVLIDAGYGILMYDERATGESEGNRRSYGWEDPADVGGALDYLNGLPGTDADKIGIGGCSIGGQIALQGAAYYPQIGAVWADGSAAITTRDLKGPLNWYTVIGTPANYLLDWITAKKLGIDIPPAMIDIIGRIEPRPVMLVSGGKSLPLTGSESIYLEHFVEHAGLNTQLWVIPEALHCDGPAWRPEEYADKLVGFFDNAFGVKR